IMKENLKILILEDVEEDAGLVNHLLKKNGLSFELKRVDTREEFTNALREYYPDVILSDHSLPQFNSVEALKICHRLHLVVPFILVTGAVSEEFAVSCLKQGADDYVLKTNLARLPSAIENALRQREFVAKQKIADQQLRLQYDALVKINQEMDNFVYSVSHNIRSPLTSVMGLLNLVQREDEQRDQFFHNYFEMMSKSVKKLDETIKEILEYSRNARSETQTEEIDIRLVVEKVFDRLKYIEGFDKTKLIISVTQDEPFYSDAYRLRIIFTNLISNAILYRDKNKSENILDVTVNIKEKIADIIVEDNGMGIEDEYLPRVFDMFFRASLKSEGAGLGLYITKEMVNKLGGEIVLESTVGQGTRCKIKLPLQEMNIQ
ncbi:MAG TPA: ATP-binding protein, partial [Cyclobacteriaceae bacterium]|nr:ATP-binding protein [Cyclobacteriaceae bacterium]